MAVLNPYINFTGDARAAMDFYQSVFGGELTRTTYSEGGMAQDPSDADKIMHSQLETPSGFTLMVSDAPSAMETSSGGNISISLSGPASDEAELRGYYEKLADGGKTVMPLEKAPWGDSFGMVTDKWGVDWMVNISGA